MNEKGRLIVFSAPSGSGKTTLVRHLLKQNLPLAFSISATSRPPRRNEVDCVDYYFLNAENFQKMIDDGAFLEYEEVYADTFYGTLKSEVERIWSEGKHVLFDVDVVGGLNIKRLFPNQTLAIFVQPPNIESLKERLRNRGDESEEAMKKRIDKAAEELYFADKFDRVIVNDNLEEAKEMTLNMVLDFIAQI